MVYDCRWSRVFGLKVQLEAAPLLGLVRGGSLVTRRYAMDLFAFESSAFRSPSAVHGVEPPCIDLHRQQPGSPSAAAVLISIGSSLGL
jgi:hypothetical protein